jgi:hypothetical protein
MLVVGKCMKGYHTDTDKEVWVPPGSPSPPQAWLCQAIGSLLYVTYISIYYRWNGNPFKEFYVYGNERWSNPLLTWLEVYEFQYNKKYICKCKMPDTEHTIFMNYLMLVHVCKQSSVSFWGDGTNFPRTCGFEL